VGFLALFPGLFEVGLSQSRVDANQTGIFIVLLTTGYGLYAVSHLIGSAVQLLGGSYIWMIVRNNNQVIYAFIILAVISLGLEVWGWLYKGYPTFFAIPGIVAGSLCVYLYYSAFRRRDAS
jgi:hypothetical protein